MRHVLDMLGQAVAIQQFTKFDCVWVGAALQPDILLLCGTWHDADLISIRRLHADGFKVVERARDILLLCETYGMVY